MKIIVFMSINSLQTLNLSNHISSSSTQALIAEKVGNYDTMDLFRHTTELSTHVRDLSPLHGSPL